jgi:FSR family fosmidomycin resistance protein-like MFS transporter
MSTTTAPSSAAAATSVTYAVLFAVSASHMINDTLQAVMLSMYPLLHETYALTFAQVGMMTMVFQVTGSILQPLIGHYTDMRPIPFSLPFAPACTLMGITLLALATSYPALLVAAAMIGVGSSIFHPEASRVARLSSGGKFGLAQSVFQVGGNFGTSLGPLLAAWIVLPSGQRSALWFISIAVLSILLLSYVGNWYNNHLGPSGRKRLVPGRSAVSSRTVVVTLVILLMLMFSKFVYTASLSSFLTFYLMEKFAVSAETAQYFLFIYLFAFAAGTILGGPIGDKIGRKAVIWFSVLGALPFTLALPFANLFWTVVLTVPIGFILASAFSAMVVYAQELLPGRVGMISGLFFGLAFGFGGIGAAILGWMADHVGIEQVFFICSFLPAIGLLTMFLPSAEQLKGIPLDPKAA